MAAHVAPDQKVERGDDFSLKFLVADALPRVLSLHTLFAEASRLEGGDRDALLRRAVLAVISRNRVTTWGEVEPRLMPSLRAAGWAAAASSEGISPLRRVFAPFVMLLMAVDDEHGMSFVTEADARTWGVDWADVSTAALANLTAKLVHVGAPADSPWLDVFGPDGYVSSWLAAPWALERFAESLDGDFVAVAKSRDSLRLIRTADRTVLAAQLERLLGEYLTEPRQLSPVPFAVRDGEIGLWEPPPGDPCRPLVDRLHRMLALTEYTLQMNVLSDLFQKAGSDVFVAKFTLMERDDKTVWSWAAWPRQVTDGLLPRTDFVCLGDLELRTNLWVPWEDAERLAHHAMRPEVGYYPPRWRVTGWPDAQVLSELQHCAVDPTAEQK